MSVTISAVPKWLITVLIFSSLITNMSLFRTDSMSHLWLLFLWTGCKWLNSFFFIGKVKWELPFTKLIFPNINISPHFPFFFSFVRVVKVIYNCKVNLLSKKLGNTLRIDGLDYKDLQEAGWLTIRLLKGATICNVFLWILVENSSLYNLLNLLSVYKIYRLTKIIYN